MKFQGVMLLVAAITFSVCVVISSSLEGRK
jgi:hypothetical protein